MILLIDNFDSFVYNLARYVEELGFSTQVHRTNKISISDIQQLKPSHIILSPGPCTPNEAGITLSVIEHFYKTIPILGVCLGHQAIFQHFGGKVDRAKKPMHGKPSLIEHNARDLFKGIMNPLKVARYHSLIATNDFVPHDLEITAFSEENEIMALQHRHYPVYGVQFHPESILTHRGHAIIKNFLESPNFL